MAIAVIAVDLHYLLSRFVVIFIILFATESIDLAVVFGNNHFNAEDHLIFLLMLQNLIEVLKYRQLVSVLFLNF